MRLNTLFIVFLSYATMFSGSWPLGLEKEFKLNKKITIEKVILGKKLFFDKNLSYNKNISCASCHKPAYRFSDNIEKSVGTFGAFTKRNTPSIINRILSDRQFWDGRAPSLEKQAIGPLFNPDEMGMNKNLLLMRISQDVDYMRMFRKAYSSKPNIKFISDAIANFERTIVSGNSNFDQFEWRGNKSALSKDAIAGLKLFRGKANCSLCHLGTNFTDEKLHDLGIGFQRTFSKSIQRIKDKQQSFKTPTLRNIALTAPYMHDGSFKTLIEVIEFYNKGGGKTPTLDKDIKPLSLTIKEKEQLLSFLHSLTGQINYVNIDEINNL